MTPPPPFTLSTTEQAELAATATGTKALAIIIDLIDRSERAERAASRDFALAAEWQEAARAAQADLQVARTRLENPHR